MNTTFEQVTDDCGVIAIDLMQLDQTKLAELCRELMGDTDWDSLLETVQWEVMAKVRDDIERCAPDARFTLRDYGPAWSVGLAAEYDTDGIVKLLEQWAATLDAATLDLGI